MPKLKLIVQNWIEENYRKILTLENNREYNTSIPIKKAIQKEYGKKTNEYI